MLLGQPHLPSSRQEYSCHKQRRSSNATSNRHNGGLTGSQSHNPPGQPSTKHLQPARQNNQFKYSLQRKSMKKIFLKPSNIRYLMRKKEQSTSGYSFNRFGLSYLGRSETKSGCQSVKLTTIDTTLLSYQCPCHIPKSNGGRTCSATNMNREKG